MNKPSCNDFSDRVDATVVCDLVDAGIEEAVAWRVIRAIRDGRVPYLAVRVGPPTGARHSVPRPVVEDGNY